MNLNDEIMKVLHRKAMSILLLAFLPILMSFIPLSLSDQQYSAANNVKITVLGTSNIHDWDLVTEQGSCTMVAQMDASGTLTGMNNLNFTVPVNSMKSKHGNTMDNNAYKAIKASSYPNITFKSSSVAVKAGGTNVYTVTAPGKLNISSGSKDVTLTGTCKVNADKSITISGSYKLNTNDYNVKPISIMLGAIKTGADVTVQYSLTAKPH
jgi:polyisoprenoid-binding protein YceI